MDREKAKKKAVEIFDSSPSAWIDAMSFEIEMAYKDGYQNGIEAARKALEGKTDDIQDSY